MRNGILSIDPGISGTGIVLWDQETWGEGYPVKVFSIEPRIANSHWVHTCNGMHEELSSIIRNYNVIKIYCEYPQYFSGDVGHAATVDGKIYKLASFVGLVMGTIFEAGGTFHPIEVTKWKGQLPKDAVIRRLQRQLPEWETKIPNIKTHCWDALGVGMFAQGRF